MRAIALLLAVSLVAGGCSIGPTDTPTPAQVEVTVEATLHPTATPKPTEPPRTRWNWLVLGGDYAPDRPSRGYPGDKTDVILLVSVNLNEPTDVAIVQFPRNLYVPGQDDYLFAIYRQAGAQGMTDYFYEVFGVELDGVTYVDMPHFVGLVDRLGGVDIAYFDLEKGETLAHFDGIGLLAWLRDNDNNWRHGVYDADNRQHKALLALGMKAWDSVKHDPLEAARAAWELRDAFETDLGLAGIVEATSVAARMYAGGWTVRFERLAAPDIVRGDVPLEPGRAEVPAVDLRAWMAGVLR